MDRNEEQVQKTLKGLIEECGMSGLLERIASQINSDAKFLEHSVGEPHIANQLRKVAEGIFECAMDYDLV